MMKKIISLIFIASLAAALVSCTGGAKKASEPLSIGVLPDVDSIPLILADHNGYFEKAGVKVDIQHFKSAAERDSAFQSGKIDGAISDVMAAALAKEGGFDVKITSMTSGSYKLLASNKSDIKDIAGLKGKNVAISKNTIIEYVTDSALSKVNIKPEEVNKVVIPQIQVRLEMLQNGKVDAATLPEPMASVAIGNGAKLLSSSDKLGINPGVIVFTKKSADSKAEEIKSFYNAYNQAVEYLQKENVSSYIDILIKESGFPESVRGTIVLPSYAKAALPSVSDFDSVIQWLKDKALIKNAYKFDDLVDQRFVR
ncbi:MAG: MetQ/NlpA family ABC transporter substrate-binding protein [Clostridiales bacterium]|jgi:NitT/TauT family transport system substrate-binding protein|nr:MetQ/NlpA family ABC transporter substrate-binding protein [Eubacteriales bacterium]MDH7566741.1 MetQ/NlpA family ABC transporter substrate-binding protein [Clostridiales bacterium]